MKKIEILSGLNVVNTIVADPENTALVDSIASQQENGSWRVSAAQDAPPAPVVSKRLTRLAFLGIMTDAEFVAIITAAKASVEVEAWLYKFNAATPEADGTSIDLADPRTIAGINALHAAGLISTATKNKYLSY